MHDGNTNNMISEKALKEFKTIYKNNFNVALSDKDALESATKLLRLVEIIYKPMTKKEYEEVQKRREETR